VLIGERAGPLGIKAGVCSGLIAGAIGFGLGAGAIGFGLGATGEMFVGVGVGEAFGAGAGPDETGGEETGAGGGDSITIDSAVEAAEV
jgi:hypothetical protein